MSDRPPGLDDLLAHLAEVLPPPTPEEEAALNAWGERMKAKRAAPETGETPDE